MRRSGDSLRDLWSIRADFVASGGVQMHLKGTPGMYIGLSVFGLTLFAASVNVTSNRDDIGKGDGLVVCDILLGMDVKLCVGSLLPQ